MFTTQFTRKFSAAHRVIGGGVCERIHGHNYVAEIIVDATVLGESNFIVPADTVKDVVDRKYDHRLILNKIDSLISRFDGLEDWIVTVAGTPSTEFLASQIAYDVAEATWEYLGGHTNKLLEEVGAMCHLKETDTIQAVGSAYVRKRP